MRDIVGLMIIVNLTNEKKNQIIKISSAKVIFLKVLLVDWGLAF